MQKFQVTIRETLERVIAVEAEDRLSALRRVRADYAVEEIVLSADDFTAVEITAEAAGGDSARAWVSRVVRPGGGFAAQRQVGGGSSGQHLL